MSRPPRTPFGSQPGDPLTDRETQVLALVAAGEPTPAISQRLAIAQNTVKSHLTRIYNKTGSRNRVDAVRYYLDHYTTHPPAGAPAPAAPATLARTRRAVVQPSLIQRQIQEIEARIDQLKPAAGELERLQHALDALRAVDTD
jgi:DNA-binding CsgD family transcriptional regulator